MTLFRFELTFDGEHQHVGLFNGMDDALSDMLSEHHQNAFARLLVIPDLPPQPGPYRYWFTPVGLAHCADALRYLLADLSANGWGYIVHAINMDHKTLDKSVYYEDPYQVALKDEIRLFAECAKPREIDDIKDFDIVLSPFITDTYRTANVCPTCKTFFSERPAVSRRNETAICPVCAMREALSDAHYSKEQQDEIVRIAWSTRKESMP